MEVKGWEGWWCNNYYLWTVESSDIILIQVERSTTVQDTVTHEKMFKQVQMHRGKTEFHWQILFLDLRNLHFKTEWKNLKEEISIILPCIPLVLSFSLLILYLLFATCSLPVFVFVLFAPFPSSWLLLFCLQETSCSGWMEHAIWSLTTSRTRTMTSFPRRRPLETLRAAWEPRKSLCTHVFAFVLSGKWEFCTTNYVQYLT